MHLCLGDKNNLESYGDLEDRYCLYFKNENLVAMSGLTSNGEYGHLEIGCTCTHPVLKSMSIYGFYANRKMSTEVFIPR